MIMFTLAMIPIFGIMGLVTDIGYMHFVKTSAQTAAEAAAQAAIIDFHATVGGAAPSCGNTGVVCSAVASTCAANITTPANSLEHGCMYAQKHGFNGTNQWVTYQAGVGGTPPTVSGISSASYWVTFRAIQKVPTMFSAILGNTSGLVAARSSAALTGASDCIYALNAHQSGAVSVGGTAQLTSSCGIYVDSDSGSALGTNGGGTLSATEYDVVGGVNTHYALTPTPNTGVLPVSDPLSNLPVPATAPYTCDPALENYSAPNWSNPTLSPGVYCGGINVGNNTYTLLPGNYILVGGGLTTQSSNSTIRGTGVFFYNTFGATTNYVNMAYSPINIAANSNVSLTARTSGTYAGILFFEDRNAPASADTYGGGSNAVYQGTIYAKNAAVTMYGNSAVNTAYTILVADTISLVGTTTFNNNYSLLPNGSPIQKVVVLE
jgi:hypothetical protein